MIGALDLGQGQCLHARRYRGLDIGNGKPQRPIDPHEHVGAPARYDLRGLLQQGARPRFFAGRHAVLEIEDDAVGTPRGGALHELARDRRHE